LLTAAALTVLAAVALPLLAAPAQRPDEPDADMLQLAADDPPGAFGREDEHHHGWGRPGGEGMRPGMMMRMMMMHHMMGLPPEQRCIERLARFAGLRAYTEAKLNLTAEQRPLWDKLETAARSAETGLRQLCDGLKGKDPESVTLLERMDRMQQFLSARLAAVEATKPAVQALYQALTPEQQAIINHPFRAH
jgi:hypothetical protein